MSITSRINEIETHLKEDYTNLEALGYDIPQDKNIENIASVLDNVWENQSHIEETGTTLSMNTNKGKAKVDLLGNTYQDSTSGKQLFNKNGSFALTGVSVSTLNTGIRVTITTAGNFKYATYKFGESEILGKTFSYNVERTSSSSNVSSFQVFYGSSFNNAVQRITTTAGTFTIDNSFPEGCDRVNFLFYANVSGTGNVNDYADFINLMVVEGTYTSSNFPDYEPYTNGASPNPTYPQDIHVDSGDNTITSTGKNIINPDFTKTITNEGLYGYVHLTDEDEDLVLSLVEKDTSVDISNIYFGFTQNGSNASGGIIWSVSNGNFNYPQVLNIQGGVRFKNVSFYPKNETTWNKIFSRFNVMVEKSSTATTYEPYVSSSYQVNLPVENYFNINATHTDMSGVTYKYEYTLKPNTQYTISSNVPNSTTANVYANGTSSSTNKVCLNTPKTITSDSNGYFYIAIRYTPITGDSGTINMYQAILDGKYYLQIEEGSKANSYTPYGTTPIELCKISTYQDKFIRNSGKNLASGLRLGFYAEATGEYTYNANYGCSISPVNVISGSTYRFSINGTYSTAYIYPYDKNGNYLGRTGTNSYGVYQPSSDVAYFNYLFGNGTISTIPLDSNIQIELGAEITPYEPYGNGDWYLKKEIGKVVLDGSETGWGVSQSSGYYRASRYFSDIYNPNDTNRHIDKIICSHFYLSIDNAIGNLFQYIQQLIFYVPSGITTLEQWVTWLSTHNTEVRYVLATPTYTKIEGTLASQLEDVWRANTYDNQTNVSQVNNDLPFELFFKALGTPSNVSLLSMNRPSLQLNNPIENVEEIEEIEESGDLDGENQESI